MTLLKQLSQQRKALFRIYQQDQDPEILAKMSKSYTACIEQPNNATMLISIYNDSVTDVAQIEATGGKKNK